VETLRANGVHFQVVNDKDTADAPFTRLRS
jgi:hypothetical protein